MASQRKLGCERDLGAKCDRSFKVDTVFWRILIDLGLKLFRLEVTKTNLVIKYQTLPWIKRCLNCNNKRNIKFERYR